MLLFVRGSPPILGGSLNSRLPTMKAAFPFMLASSRWVADVCGLSLLPAEIVLERGGSYILYSLPEVGAKIQPVSRA